MLYGREHIIILAVSAAVLALSVVLLLCVFKTDKQKTVFMRCFGGVLAAAVISNRIAYTVWDHNGFGALELIPNTYCGMSGLLLGIIVAMGKRDHPVYNFLFYAEIIGGVAGLLAPNFLAQGPSVWFFPTFSSLLHHAIGVVLCVLLVVAKWYVPTLKNWYYCPLGVGIYTLFGLFLLQTFGIPDTMLIDKPAVSGTVLYWWFIFSVGTAAAVIIGFVTDKAIEYYNDKRALNTKTVG